MLKQEEILLYTTTTKMIGYKFKYQTLEGTSKSQQM